MLKGGERISIAYNRQSAATEYTGKTLFLTKV
jgi:hypothetical protein